MGHGSDHCIDHDTPMSYCHQCRDDEIARLESEVVRLRDGFNVQVEAIARRDRALAAGPAALRDITDDYDGAAEIVKAAQEAAMKEKG